MRIFFYWVCIGFVRLVSAVMFRLKIYGKAHFPHEGPFLIIANHASFLDPLLVAAACPQRIRWVVRKDVYHWRIVHTLCRAADCIPLNGARAAVLEALAAGDRICVFPEGRRTPHGKLITANPKSALLALESGVPVIPVALKGAYEAYPPERKTPRPHPIEIHIGEPLYFDGYVPDKPVPEEVLCEVTERIMGSIRNLGGGEL